MNITHSDELLLSNISLIFKNSLVLLVPKDYYDLCSFHQWKWAIYSKISLYLGFLFTDPGVVFHMSCLNNLFVGWPTNWRYNSKILLKVSILNSVLKTDFAWNSLYCIKSTLYQNTLHYIHHLMLMKPKHFTACTGFQMWKRERFHPDCSQVLSYVF